MQSYSKCHTVNVFSLSAFFCQILTTESYDFHIIKPCILVSLYEFWNTYLETLSHAWFIYVFHLFIKLFIKMKISSTVFTVQLVVAYI